MNSNGYNQYDQEDEQSYLNWQRSLCNSLNEGGSLDGIMRENNQRDESDDKDQNLDISFHL